MGAFNTLIIEEKCNNCNRFFSHRLQFKFGEVWQYEYNVGDKIIRGNPHYDKGAPDLPKVRVQGHLENEICPYCHYKNPDEYDILIEKDVIKGISLIADPEKYNDDYYYEDR